LESNSEQSKLGDKVRNKRNPLVFFHPKLAAQGLQFQVRLSAKLGVIHWHPFVTQLIVVKEVHHIFVSTIKNYLLKTPR